LLAARRGALVLAYLDAERLGEVMEDLRGLALGKQSAVEIDATLDYVIGGASKRLHDWPVSADICGRADFIPGAIDKRHVDVSRLSTGAWWPADRRRSIAEHDQRIDARAIHVRCFLIIGRTFPS
jgi:hypothetical protein